MTVQMKINSFKLEPEGETTTSLYELVGRYQRKELLLPPHQRDRVWDTDKKEGWVSRLQSDLRPIGVIVTYQLKNAKPCYINDGFQRISTSYEYLFSPEEYGDTREAAAMNLRSINMPIQHRHYLSHDEAMTDFQQINMGTHLTTYEYCKGILTYINNYEMYEPSITLIVQILEDAQLRLINKRKISRTQNHKMYRNSYAIFYRYLTEDTLPSSYQDIPNIQIKQSIVNNKKNIEWKLRLAIESLNSPTKFEKKVKNFQMFIEREIALIENIWFEEMGKGRGDGLSQTFLRWLLDVSVWRSNNNISIPLHKKFLHKVLDYTQGKSYVVVFDENHRPLYNMTLGLSKLSGLSAVCDQIGASDFAKAAVSSGKRHPKKRRAGYDDSHKKPFSIFGEGETFSEPGNVNRSRGANTQ